MITKEEAVKAYDQLVQFRQQNQLYKTKENLGKVETHHILPTSCGGEDVPENRIDLLAKEHFMAHVYLWIIHHEDEFHYKTMCALNMMVNGTLDGSRKELRDFILMSEEYQKVREEFAQYSSQTIGEKVSGKNNGAFGKHWYYDPTTLSCAMLFEEDVPDGWINGRTYSSYDGFKIANQKIAEKNKGKIQVYNPLTKEQKRIKPTDKIPDGFGKGGRPITDDEKRRISNTLKTKSPKGTLNPKHIQEQIEFLRPRYAYYLEFGFDAMAKMFDYPYSLQNFSMGCKQYLPEYVKHARYKKK